MRPARILLLLIAVVAGGLAAFLAMRTSGPTIIRQVAAPAQETATKVLVAKSPIGVGQRLSATEVEWQSWPDNAVRPEYITIAKTPNAPTDVTGTVARFEIFQGEPILDAKLVHSDQGFLSAVLPKGMRGVSVPVTAASGSGGFIIPNDRVDVVVTDSVDSQTVSHVVLSDVKVLAIGARLGQSGTTGAPADPNDPKSQIFSSTIATLELTPAQSQTLINSTETGKISLVLRSVADFAQAPSADVSAQNDNQTVKIIRFGRQASVMAGGAGEAQASVSPAAYVPPAIPVAPPATVITTTQGASGSSPDTTVTIVSPTTVTSSPPVAAPAE